MDYQVTLTPSAIRDLREIDQYISLDSPERALGFCNSLILATRQLGQFPAMGRKVPELDNLPIREVVKGSYRIIYRMIDSNRSVQILRFWHAARGTPKLHG